MCMHWVNIRHLYCIVKYLDKLTVQMLSRERLYLERFVLYIYWTRHYIPSWLNVFYLWNKNTVTPSLMANFEVQLRFKLKWNEWAWKRALNLRRCWRRQHHLRIRVLHYVTLGDTIQLLASILRTGIVWLQFIDHIGLYKDYIQVETMQPFMNAHFVAYRKLLNLFAA